MDEPKSAGLKNADELRRRFERGLGVMSGIATVGCELKALIVTPTGTMLRLQDNTGLGLQDRAVALGLRVEAGVLWREYELLIDGVRARKSNGTCVEIPHVVVRWRAAQPVPAAGDAQ